MTAQEVLDRGDKLAFNIKEAAGVLGVDPRTLSRACTAGQIPSFKIGRLRLIARDTLVRLLTADAA